MQPLFGLTRNAPITCGEALRDASNNACLGDQGKIRSYPESSTFNSLLLSSFMVDTSIVSCAIARVLALSFTGGLSTGTAT